MARPSPGQPQSPATNTHQYEGIGQAGHGGADNTRFAKISVIANLRMNLFQALLHIPVAACATVALGKPSFKKPILLLTFVNKDFTPPPPLNY